MSTVPRQSQQQNPRGLLGGMAYNPLMSLGAGLLQAAGPSFEPQGLGQGLSQGLLNMQRAQQFQSMDADRKARAELLQKRAQLEQAKMQAEEEERARQEQLRLQQQAAIPHLVGLLPPEQQAQAQAYLNAYPGAGQELFGSALLPKPTKPVVVGSGGMLVDPNTGKVIHETPRAPNPMGLLAMEMAKDRQLALQMKNAEMQAKAEERELTADRAVNKNIEETGDALKAVRRAREAVNRSTAGIPGSILKNIPGTKALALSERLSTVKSVMVMGSMAMLKELSATGSTGFGSISAPELKLFQDKLASLDQAQDQQELLENLETIEKFYTRAQAEFKQWKKTRAGIRSKLPANNSAADVPPQINSVDSALKALD